MSFTPLDRRGGTAPSRVQRVRSRGGNDGSSSSNHQTYHHNAPSSPEWGSEWGTSEYPGSP
eukprot:CAMPEP_0114393788 /NCGR_PEP_ID=MMETSP0102-20121206/11763_1 /TAXON_ID=38822 ORGANISM="Pteridomonas danica, Strain PT" /NCGR_SAMPLE_ID=MMETSP0102 /ASSEMBLY_ACC=CAM_ASM_000212 /LENGTH=60 /DNA_ID=CAMNT_0001553547 /DNA_START=169 /DNA_END=348 /DNA_ORIENTATION=+